MTPTVSVWELIALWLAARHRRRQDAIADTVASSVARSWRYIDFERLDETTLAWIDAATPSVRYGFERSQMATASFTRDYRQVAGYASDVTTPVTTLPRIVTARQYAQPVEPSAEGRTAAPQINQDRLNRMLAAAGPGRVKRSLPTFEDRAMAIGQRGAEGAAVQFAMDGGRGVTRLETYRDSKVLGYQRMTDTDPCAFCALLAANGPVFAKKSYTASDDKFLPNVAYDVTGEPDGIAKVHDHCRCTLIPVYSEFELIDPVGQIAKSLWSTASQNRSAKEALPVYRRLYRAITDGVETPFGDIDVNSATVLAAIEAELERINGSTPGARFLRSVAQTLSIA